VLREWKQQTAPGEEAFMMIVSPDGTLAATATARAICLWDVDKGEELANIPLPSQIWFVELLFHPDGKSLFYSAIGLGIHRVELAWRNQPGSSEPQVGFGRDHKLEPSNDLMALEFAPDGKSIIVAENKQSAKNEQRSPDIWLWANGDPARAHKLAGDWPLVGYHMSKDGRWGLTSHITEPDITVWDPNTGQRIRGLGFADPITFEMTPDGGWLLASLRDSYQLIEIGSWKPGARWPAEFSQVHYRCCTFSQDGSLVATAAPNGRVEVRTLPDARLLILLPLPKTTQLKALNFTADNSRLITMTGAGVLQDWNLAELRRALAAQGLDWSVQKNRQ
jgi:WD40 repeat protein